MEQRTPEHGPFGFPEYPLRSRVLGEIHSRPFQLIETPRTVLQLAFLAEDGSFATDLAMLAKLAQSRGHPGPEPDARQFFLPWGTGRLRWERHTEFVSWTFDAPGVTPAAPLPVHPFGDGFAAPGPLISAIRLDLIRPESGPAALALFDPTSLSYSEMEGGLARAATDFRQDGNGFTRILVLDYGLGPARAGALTQRLMEIETYRTLAVLGLPLAQRLAPAIGRIEEELARITGQLAAGERSSDTLLDELVGLAAEMESEAAASLHRFGASRAYDEIVTQRLQVIGEMPIPGHDTWHAFLFRRMAPAMRTCRSVEARQESLSRKLARAANLLRTRVDVELEQQNRDLLQSMNRRAKLQLRLQQTVEGLSVAAITYYVVGLVGYVAKGLQDAGLPVNPTIAAALAVPPVALVIWWLIRRSRRHYGET